MARSAGIVKGLVATMVAQRLAVRMNGQASKRGLIPRVPAPDRLLGDAEAWIRTEYADQLRGARRTTGPNGEPQLELDLYPAAPPVVVTALESGHVEVAAETVTVGPGYHRFVARLLERLGTELDIDWSQAIAIDPDAAATMADRATTERGYLSWLGPALADARSARRIGAGGQHVGTPAGVAYTLSSALGTALGPRDDAWLESAIADPRIAIEITPWWLDATDGRYLLNRALAMLWTEVRWRRPAVDGEAETLDEVHRLLSRAFPLEPGLPYPWHAWAEVIAFRGIEDAMSRQVLDRVSTVPAPAEPIGYRRDEVTITHEGWALRIPGEFAERRTAEEWWGGGAGRAVTLAATDTGAMTAGEFLTQVANDLGGDMLTHQNGAIAGRARITSDESSGLAVGVLDGFSAIRGSGAAIRIVFDDPNDWQWALDLWRLLAPA
jgi:hypothetical protein